MKFCFFLVKFVSHVVKSWQKFHDFFIFWRFFWHRFHNRWAHFYVFFGRKSKYMLVKLKKNMIKKVFFVSKPPYVKQSWILIWTLVSSIGETHRKWSKVFQKKQNSFPQYVRMVKFSCRFTIGKTRFFSSKFWKSTRHVIHLWKSIFTLNLHMGENLFLFFEKNVFLTEITHM